MKSLWVFILAIFLFACSSEKAALFLPTDIPTPTETISLPIMEGSSCQEIVTKALEQANSACEGTARNEACYGNITLLAEGREGYEINFSSPGDIESLVGIKRLSLSPFNSQSEEWGVSILRVQANLPDTVPGANVTFVLFGNVEISEEERLGNPLEAFYFKSGVGDAPCEEAPDSGILVQTPEGQGTINFRVNEVDIALGSTAYLQAQPGGQLSINVLEGLGQATSFGVTELIPAGTQVEVPLGTDLKSSGPPTPAQAYDSAQVAVVPVNTLPMVVSAAPPVETSQIIQTNGSFRLFQQDVGCNYSDAPETYGLVDSRFNPETGTLRVSLYTQGIVSGVRPLVWCQPNTAYDGMTFDLYWYQNYRMYFESQVSLESQFNISGVIIGSVDRTIQNCVLSTGQTTVCPEIPPHFDYEFPAHLSGYIGSNDLGSGEIVVDVSGWDTKGTWSIG